jgi:tetratricopeptide (TPR) repeat protein
MQIIVKLKDVIIDPAKPVDLTAMPAEKAIALLRKAYGFLAANMTFEIRAEMVFITVDYGRRQDEDTARDCFDRGMKQAKSGRYNKAVDLFNRVLKIVPEHTEARRNLAMALKNSNRLPEAKDHLVDVLRLSPDDSWAYVLLGNIYAWHENDLDTAERFYRRALESTPQDTYALTNYAALKTQRRDRDGARALFEQVIALEPKQPNPYYGLATLLNDSDKPADALATLDRMFDAADFEDARVADLRKECREFFLRVSAQVAETDHEQLWRTVLAYRDEVASITGFPVELVEDNDLEDTTATSVPAWKGADRHVVRYNSRGKPVIPHIVARELEAIRMGHEARQAGKACDLAYAGNNPERTKTIDDHVRRLASGDPQVRDFVTKATDTLMSRLLLTPVDVLVECRLWEHLPGIRPSHTVSLYLHARQKRNPLEQAQVARALPETVKRAHETSAAAWAIFIDGMCAGRTAYAADYARSPGFPMARELAESWQQASMDFHPGDEYALARQFVQALRLDSWLRIAPAVQ